MAATEAPKEHPSHDIRKMDLIGLCSMPECVLCGLSPHQQPLSMALPCGSPFLTFFWLGSEGGAL